MLESFGNKAFEYRKLTEGEQKQRGILGRLIGPCADFHEPTRNGRKYSESLWNNVFENPIMKEKIANRCAFGELGHPEDRTEVDMEKIALCLAEAPKKGNDGKLYAVFDILNTPCGKILKALCDYGCKIGISSRGQGDLVTDDDGEEAVDPETYDCECFDAVLVPGVESARLKYVTESYNTRTKKTLKQTLAESLMEASEDDRKIMKDKLDELDIDLEDTAEEMPAKDISAEDLPVDNIDDLPSDDIEDVTDVENPDELTDLDAEENPEEEDERSDEEIFLDFLANNFDEKQIKKVCKILDIEILDDEDEEEKEDDEEEEVEDTDDESDSEDETESEEDEESDDDKKDKKDKADEAEEDVDEALDKRSNALVNSLKEAIKSKSDLENVVKSLREQLAVSDAKVSESAQECKRYQNAITRLSELAKSTKDLKLKASSLQESLSSANKTIDEQKARISRLVKSRKETIQADNSINESVQKKDAEITALNENLNSNKTSYEKQLKSLTEQLNSKEKEAKKQIGALNENLTKANNLKDGYKKLANKAVNKYIDVKANMLGLTSTDIKRKLGESYTIEDVDQVCEDLKAYQLNVSKLPFSLDKKLNVRVTESANGRLDKTNNPYDDDDDISSLLRMSGLE